MQRLALVVTAVAFPLAPAMLAGQETPPAQQTEALRVFLDCQTFFCDFDHFRREITYVSWVRDRQDAQVHILGTGQGTGGGGREFTFTFIGLQDFAGRSDTLRYVSRNTDTEAEIRDGQVRTVKVGLVRYVALTPAVERLQITYQAPQAGTPAPQQENDPWNLWVFTTRIGGNFNGEKLQSFSSVNGSVTANRTAEGLKINLRVSGNYSRRKQELTAGTFESTSKNISASELVVWSLGDHWSLGVRSFLSVSTFFNQDLSVRGGPAIEYNVYPYAESTRRQLTLLYTVEPTYFNYEEETIFNKTEETLPSHRLTAQLQVQQPWGSVGTTVNALQYLNDLNKHSVNLFGFISLRIVRGLDLRISGGASRIKDQLYLVKGGLTDEEILIRRRQLGTDFTYFTSLSLGFRFGSKFANVVNPRMSGGEEGIFFFF